MSARRQRCPYCNVFSALPEGSEYGVPCPECGQILVALSGSSAGPPPPAEIIAGVAKVEPAPSSIPQTALGNLQSAVTFCEFDSAHEKLSEAQVVPESANCVQCGMCTYNCPMGIDVRAHAWRGKPIRDSHCLTCSECVNRCPRGVLRFERIPLFVMK